MTAEPATALIHHLREAEDYAKCLTRSRDMWIEHSVAKYDEGYERGYADAVTDFRNANPAEDWHGKATNELDNNPRPPTHGSGVPRGGR